MTITEFLLARIAEDEASIEDLIRSGDHSWWGWKRYEAEREAKRRIIEEHHVALRLDHVRVVGNPAGYEDRPVEDHCVVCDPESDDSNGPCLTLRALASVYADHPDYDPEWTPRA